MEAAPLRGTSNDAALECPLRVEESYVVDYCMGSCVHVGERQVSGCCRASTAGSAAGPSAVPGLPLPGSWLARRARHKRTASHSFELTNRPKSTPEDLIFGR